MENFGENRTVFLPTNLRMDPIYISIYVTWMYLVKKGLTTTANKLPVKVNQ
jgi:hypothetical protein